MTSSNRSNDECFVAREILMYLQDHPRAQDTEEGIAHWWLLEREIVRNLKTVRSALRSLVSEGYLEERPSRDSCPRYALNPDKAMEIRQILVKDPCDDGDL